MKFSYCLLLCFLITGCRSAKIVEVERSHEDSTLISRDYVDSLILVNHVMDSIYWKSYFKDSTFVKDSTFTYVYENGTKETYHEKEVFKYIISKDTIYQTKEKDNYVQSLQKQIEDLEHHKIDFMEVPVEVEKKLSWYERFSIKWCWKLMLVIVAFLGYKAFRLYLKWK